MKTFNARLAAATASCAALLLATGCVSKQEYSRIVGERDQVSLDLSQTRTQRDEASQTSERLTRELAAARTESDAHAKRAAEIAAVLSQAEGSLASAQRELKTTQRNLETTRGELKVTQGNLARAQQDVAQTREKLVGAEKRAAQVATELEESRSAYAKLQDESRARAEEAAAQLGDARTALSVAIQKEQAELESTRRKLADAEQAANDARARLAQTEKRVVDLETKVRTLSSQAKKPAEDKAKDAGETTASVAVPN